MPIRQQIVVIILAGTIFISIFNLVYLRRLREEYSWLWLFTSFFLIVLTLRYEMLVKLTHMIGAVLPTSTLFFFSIIFLMLLCIHFSLRLTEHTNHIKKLAQELAIMRAEAGNMSKGVNTDNSSDVQTR